MAEAAWRRAARQRGGAGRGAAPAGAEIGGLPLHDFALIMLGIHLFDNTNLEAVGQAAAQRKRWDFLLTAAPLPVRERHRIAAQSDCRVLRS